MGYFFGLFITNQPTNNRMAQSMWAPRRLANAAVGLREQREKVEETMVCPTIYPLVI